VEVRAVDERDSNWENANPRFRIYLHGSGESTTSGWTATYDITGADVLQAIDWAQRPAGHSLTYAVALVCDDNTHQQSNPGYERGLVWLVGMDGNDSAWDDREAAVQKRMLSRRREPVGVPQQDRIPEGLLSLDAATIERPNELQPPR
jgi:hypothetical protein